jgi:hypothetical protein
MGGLRSGRERKLCVDPDCPEEIVEIPVGWFASQRVQQYSAYGTHAATLRNFFRVCLMLSSLLFRETLADSQVYRRQPEGPEQDRASVFVGALNASL